jgi:hypothetical protein
MISPPASWRFVDAYLTGMSGCRAYCVACNHAKQAPGRRSEITGPSGKFVIITLTGHRYDHAPPALSGAKRARSRSPVERRLAERLAAA